LPLPNNIHLVRQVPEEEGTSTQKIQFNEGATCFINGRMLFKVG